MATSTILWLGERACHDRALVGGKAAELSRLAAAYPVPPGFCMTGRAAGGDAPSELDDEIALAYGALADRCGDVEPAVAVRSSALDEDGALASFAGQHDTYLGIVGAAAVAAAVTRCRASLHSSRALAYRSRHGLATTDVRLAVLVQQLVVADVSAVLFSANPLTGSRDEVVITANWGLGESLVGGTVTPDTYVVRKGDLAVISRQIGDKRHMTVAVPGGAQEVAVPRLLRMQPTLTDEQAAELARLALSLEAATGRPVDVECAYRAGRLYLLQCRPITTLDLALPA